MTRGAHGSVLGAASIVQPFGVTGMMVAFFFLGEAQLGAQVSHRRVSTALRDKEKKFTD